MLRLPDIDNRIRWLMIEELEQSEADATLFVPDFLTAEGREDYSSMFRSAILQRGRGMAGGRPLGAWAGRGLRGSGASKRGGAALVSPCRCRALVRGEYNRLQYVAPCAVRRWKTACPNCKCSVRKGSGTRPRKWAITKAEWCVQPRRLFDGLRTDTLDAFLGLPQGHREAVLTARRPR